MSVWKKKYKPMDKLKAKIHDLGLNTHSFAMEIGIPYMNVYRWVNGINAPSMRDVKRIACFLNCPIDDIVE